MDEQDATKTYLIHSPDTGTVKIGVSVEPEKRLGGVQTGNPHRLELLASISGDRERELHEILKTDRLCGEWFTVTDRNRQTIADAFGIEPRKLGHLKKPKPRAPVDLADILWGEAGVVDITPAPDDWIEKLVGEVDRWWGGELAETIEIDEDGETQGDAWDVAQNMTASLCHCWGNETRAYAMWSRLVISPGWVFVFSRWPESLNAIHRMAEGFHYVADPVAAGVVIVPESSDEEMAAFVLAVLRGGPVPNVGAVNAWEIVYDNQVAAGCPPTRPIG